MISWSSNPRRSSRSISSLASIFACVSIVMLNSNQRSRPGIESASGRTRPVAGRTGELIKFVDLSDFQFLVAGDRSGIHRIDQGAQFR